MPKIPQFEDPSALGCVKINEDPSRRSLAKIPVTFNWGDLLEDRILFIGLSRVKTQLEDICLRKQIEN